MEYLKKFKPKIAKDIEKAILNYSVTKSDNSSIIKSVYDFKINQIISYIDPKSPNYDKNIFSRVIKYEDIYKIVEDPFSGKMWTNLKIEEKKRLNVKHIQEPNTNLVCKKCKTKNVFNYERQTRSADEPATQFYVCVKCNYKWTG